MKRFLGSIAIGAFLALSAEQAFAATAPVVPIKSTDQTPIVSPMTFNSTDIDTQLHDILNRFTGLSVQTQTAIDQLSLNNIDTTQAQASLDTAKADISKAKATLALPKYSQKTVEDQLQAIRTDILQSLAYLKAGLPTLDQSGQ